MTRLRALYPRLDRARYLATRTVAGGLPIALYVSGVGAVFHGLDLWSPPVAWIFVGLVGINWGLKLDPPKQ